METKSVRRANHRLTDLAVRLLLPTPGFSTRNPLIMDSALAGTWVSIWVRGLNLGYRCYIGDLFMFILIIGKW